jgi:hypothetical protein
MAPRTRQSHTKGSASSAQAKENEHDVPFDCSSVTDTRKCSKIAARRVLPETQSQTLQPGGSRTMWSQTRLTLGKCSENVPIHNLRPQATPIPLPPSRQQHWVNLPRKHEALVSPPVDNDHEYLLIMIRSKALLMVVQCLSCYPVGMKSKVAGSPVTMVVSPSSSANPPIVLREASKWRYNAVSCLV